MSSTGPQGDQPSLRRKVIIASVWATATRWGNRLLGLVSIAILARLLTPDDFGLIAAALAFIGVAEALMSLGIDWALIERQDDDKKLYDSAWTLRLLKNILIAVLLLCGAGLAADYAGDQRIVPIIWVLAIGMLIQGLENIGVVNFRKHLNFEKEFLLQVLPKVVAVILSVVAALILQSYWALVIGLFGRWTLQTIVSYVLHPMRPWFSLERFDQIWGFSKWMIFNNIGNKLFHILDRFLLAGTLPKNQLAFYTVGSDTTSILTIEMAMPVSQVLLPSFAKLKHEKERLRQAYLKSLGIIMAISLPVCLGVSSVSYELTLLLLGDQWPAAVPIIQATAIVLVFQMFIGAGDPLVLMTGMVKHAGITAIVALIIFALLFFPVLGAAGIMGVIAWKGLVLLGRFLVISYFGLRRVEEPMITLWRLMQRPLLAAIVMYCAVLTIDTGALALIPALLIKAAAGGLTYTLVLLGLWQVSGRPDGAEKEILELAQGRLGSRR